MESIFLTLRNLCIVINVIDINWFLKNEKFTLIENDQIIDYIITILDFIRGQNSKFCIKSMKIKETNLIKVKLIF